MTILEIRAEPWRGGRALMLAGAAAVAACTPQLGPPAGSVAALPAQSKAPSEPEVTRDSYVAGVLTRPIPEALQGLREVGAGTGFYVAPNAVLTNFHVAGDCVAVTVGNGLEAAETPARLLAGDPGDDLALIGVDAPGAPAAFETALDAEGGGDLAILGYPAHGMVVRIAELSPVTAKQPDLLADRPTFPFQGEVHPGNSGSPVLDGKGAVLGVVVKKIDTVAVYRRTGEVVDNVGIAIANRIVLTFLRQNRIAIREAEPKPPLAHDRLIETAHGFVRQIGCWQRR